MMQAVVEDRAVFGQGVAAVQPLPLGRRSPRGKLRWYLVSCAQGREQVLCDRVRTLVPKDLLQDAFVPRVERVRKHQGVWIASVAPLFRGFFIVATTDAPALSKQLAALSFSVRLAGGLGEGYAPLARGAQDFLVQVMDAAHVIRRSQGQIVNGQLRITSGPLVGQEWRVQGIDRHKSSARVCVCERPSDAGRASQAGGFMLTLPLEVPVKINQEEAMLTA